MKLLASVGTVIIESLAKQLGAIVLIIAGLVVWVACASADQALDGLVNPPVCPGRPVHPVSL